ncbi:hypothetical protein J2Z35_002886 [Acetoanaerobium pronyense]|uniref:Uncharacterized protein n=1 Tax=Acetoanaerobium pronyense TaxID=1482736 RepID=A0ABS4KMN9_9FIRM|nr:hypothetical protein [Acetoanaerobium pronyense]MBP2029048.1 hypothetical protein [Acetoanaerobium pronyense]
MSNPTKIINSILVDLFKHILDIEEKSLRSRGVTGKIKWRDFGK